MSSMKQRRVKKVWSKLYKCEFNSGSQHPTIFKSKKYLYSICAWPIYVAQKCQQWPLSSPHKAMGLSWTVTVIPPNPMWYLTKKMSAKKGSRTFSKVWIMFESRLYQQLNSVSPVLKNLLSKLVVFHICCHEVNETQWHTVTNCCFWLVEPLRFLSFSALFSIPRFLAKRSKTRLSRYNTKGIIPRS